MESTPSLQEYTVVIGPEGTSRMVASAILADMGYVVLQEGTASEAVAAIDSLGASTTPDTTGSPGILAGIFFDKTLVAQDISQVLRHLPDAPISHNGVGLILNGNHTLRSEDTVRLVHRTVTLSEKPSEVGWRFSLAAFFAVELGD